MLLRANAFFAAGITCTPLLCILDLIYALAVKTLAVLRVSVGRGTTGVLDIILTLTLPLTILAVARYLGNNCVDH